MKYRYDDSVIAIIPARSGSKGIIDKNITDINGFPMLAYSITAAKLVDKINRVIISTDSERYAEIAKGYGAEAPFLRPAELSSSDSLDIDYLQHTLNYLLLNENSIPRYIVLLRPTTPLRDTGVIRAAIDLIYSRPDASSVVSVHAVEECPYKWMVISKSGYLTSPFTEMEPDDVGLPRQSFQTVYNPDGYVDVLRSDIILEDGYVYGHNAIPYLINNSVVDIDTYHDLDVLMQNDFNSNEIYNYMKTHY